MLEALSQATLSGYKPIPCGRWCFSPQRTTTKQFLQRDQLQLDPVTEITITPGATIAIFCAIQACIHADDEVIIFDPSYDSYAPAVQLAGEIRSYSFRSTNISGELAKVKDCINAKLA